MSDKGQLARIDQKLTDFMNLYKEHRADDLSHREKMDALAKKVDRMERPLKWAAGVVSVSMVGVLTVLGEKAIQWTVDAVHAAKSLSK